MLGPRAGALSRGARRALTPPAVLGASLVTLLALFALFGPLLTSHDPLVSDFAHGVSRTSGPVGPSSTFLLGTDRIFRDELARLAYGARLSLLIGVAATAIASVVGAAVGIVSGFYEGSSGVRVPWAFVASLGVALALVIAGRPGLAALALALGAAIAALAVARNIARPREGPRLNADGALMRVVDVGLSFPFLLLVMAIGAALDRTTVATIFAILGLTGWLGTARVIRAKTMQIRNLEFIVAARALGQSTPQILLRHVLPNVAGPLIVIATVSVAQMILAETVLGYLGVGISPPTPTWGQMLYEGQDYYLAAPWLVLAPAGAICLSVLGFNLLGEGLRDALDPKAE